MAIVAEAADGEEGARVIRRERPDVVLLDVRMPGRNGIDLPTEPRTDELPPTTSAPRSGGGATRLDRGEHTRTLWV